MEKLIIGNNELDCAFFGISGAGNIQMIIVGKSIAEIAQIVTNDDIREIYLENTKSGTRQLYQGYTVINTIAATDNGIRVSLRRKFIGE